MEDNLYMSISYRVSRNCNVLPGKKYVIKFRIKKIENIRLSKFKDSFEFGLDYDVYFLSSTLHKYYENILREINGERIKVTLKHVTLGKGQYGTKHILFQLDYKTILRNKKIEEILT